MDSSTIIGLIIGALAIIIPLFITCVTPLIKLNNAITKLNDSIKQLNQELDKTEINVDKIKEMLNAHNMWLVMDKKRLDNHEERLTSLDHKIGFNDNEDRSIKR